MGRRVSLTVQLTDDALHVLDDMHAFVAATYVLSRADQLVDGISASLAKLSMFPERGEYPKELSGLGMREFRQVHHKPYRMIYQVGREAVTVLPIADGRRDVQALLQRRLLSG